MGKSNIDLSVIIACYNVGDYLKDCLSSLVQTKFPHDRIEILPVDDGSTDGKTPRIIDDFAKKYNFVTALHKKNGGLSDAIKYGMDHSHGKYFAFVDGDDIVPANAYSDLMYAAETYNSNIVSGFVRRFDNTKNVGSYLHKFAIKYDKFDTTIKDTPSLLYDTTAWNKVYKASFMRKHNLRYVTGILYEDLPLELKAHLLSNNDSIVSAPVYEWRWRSNSITESRSALNNFLSRIYSLSRCRTELIQFGFGPKSELYHDFIHKVLMIDLPIFLQNSGDREESYVYKVQEIAYRFLRDWHLLNSDYLTHLPVKFQVLYYAVQTGNLPLLKKYTYIQSLGTFSHTHFTKHYNYNINLSDNAIKHLNFKDNTLRSTQSLVKANSDPDNTLVEGKGMFKIKHLHMLKKAFSSDNHHEKLSAKLVNLTNGAYMNIQFSRLKTPAYKRIMHPKTSWTNSRYHFNFDYSKALTKLGQGIWKILVTDNVDNKYIIQAYLGQPAKSNKGSIKRVRYNKYMLSSGFDNEWDMIFKAQPLEKIGSDNTNWITKASVNKNELSFEAGLTNPSYIVPRIVFNEDLNQYLDGVVVNKGHDHEYDLVFNLAKWPSNLELKDYKLVLLHKPTNHEIHYLFASPSKDSNYVTLPSDDLHNVIAYYGGKQIRVGCHHSALDITDKQLTKNNALKFTVKVSPDYKLDDKKLNQLKIEMLTGGLKYRIILTKSKNNFKLNKNILTFEVPLLTKDRKQLLVLKGNYNFYAYIPMNNHMIETNFTVEDSAQDDDKQSIALRGKDKANYQLTQKDSGEAKLEIKQPRAGFTAKKSHRAIAYSLLYPLMRLLPLRNVAIFDSYWASQFSSNEKAIYEYMQKHYPNIKDVWFFKNDQIPIDGNGKRIKTKSLKYWYYLAVAKYIFQNANMPNRYYKRNGQIETETLHGTFLKHMGFDEPYFKNGSKKIQNNFAKRIRRWDYMIVPSKYMDKIASHAFDYHQNILPSGFPRTDELIKNNNQKYINSIKHKLGIPLNKKVILYAPTFRQHDKSFHLDLNHLQKRFGKNYVLLVRLHYFVAHSNSFYENPGFVYDVSDYPDINDLFLISDAMITDYSSVMFDYANLKRPMIFYPFDEDTYLDDHFRGTYLDYKHEMPGPIVTTQAGVEDCIANLPQVAKKYHSKIVSFNHRFDEYDTTDKSTQKAVDAILHTPKSKLDQVTPHGVILKKLCHWLKIRNLQAGLLHHLGNILPTKNIIIFDSFFGSSFSDNPKAIYEYIKKHYPKYKLYWNVNINDVPYFKIHHIPYVIRFSYSGIKKQAEAKYFIVNSRRPFRWKVPKGAKLLQTWHGTPLKTIGADVSLVTMPGSNAKKYHKQVYKDNRRWNYLLAPNMYSEHIMQRAFRMKANQMILSGYPRNDILVNHNNPTTINKIKNELGIAPWKKVILYAPTWRDNNFIKNDEYVAHLHLDLDKIKKHYGHKVVVLVRTHYMISNRLDLSKYKDIAINVSSYPDIAKLYLISDVLITDYSSVMFDYSILKRPMIFFDYDYSNYAKNTRGFYFNFKKVAPGKIVQTTDQVIKQLDDVFNHHWTMSDNYRKFYDKFDKWMDGKSSQRAAEQFLNDSNVHSQKLTRTQMKLPQQVTIKDGSLMWNFDKNFTDPKSVKYHCNYNYNSKQKFNVLKGVQLQSTSFNQFIGMRYVLVKLVHSNKLPVWVNASDIVNNNLLNP